jgi:predicted secreted protein
VTVAPDDTITVTLCSNPSTGFAWERATISNPGVLGLSDQRLIQPQAATPIVGAAGQERWQFDVRASDTTTVDFRYSQPWDGGTKNAWSLTLRVTASS